MKHEKCQSAQLLSLLEADFCNQSCLIKRNLCMLVIAHIISKISSFSVGFYSVQFAEYIILLPFHMCGTLFCNKKVGAEEIHH
jgi:hypothetical protein